MINSLLCGDCLEVMKDIPNRSVDLILTDLPFNQTRNKWDCMIPLKPLWEQYNRIARENSAIVLFGQGLFTARLILSNERFYRYSLVWDKTSASGFLNAKKMPLRAHEDIVVFYKKLPTYNPQKTTGHPRKVSTARHKRNSVKTTNYGEHRLTSYDSTERYPISILRFPKDTQKSALHPTQKPVALLEYLIRTYSNEGDVVLDSCAGSGSTLLAAKNTNRSYIGIEVLEEYFKVIKERLK